MSALRKPAPTSSIETEIKQWLDSHVAAIRTKDLMRVLSNYAPDVILYDIMPPLTQNLSEARKNYEMFFKHAKDIKTYEAKELHVMAKDNFAYCHFLLHCTFDFKDGYSHQGQKNIDNWMRCSMGLCQIKGQWKIIHEHVSAPIDMETGKGLMNLKP